MSITPSTRPPASALKISTWTPIAQERRHGRQREIAVDDGGDRREDLEDRLEDVARARARVLAEEDRRAETARHGDEERPERDDERRGDERHDAERAGLEERRPVRAREEVQRADLGEELERREQQRDDDPDRRDDGDQRASPRSTLTTASPSRRLEGRRSTPAAGTAAPSVVASSLPGRLVELPFSSICSR